MFQMRNMDWRDTVAGCLRQDLRSHMALTPSG